MKKIYLKIVVILLVGFCFLSKDAQAYDDKVLAQLTPKELEIYQDGKMTSGEYVTGGLLGTFVGFGLGHAIQGRYGSTGWIYTLAETGLLVATTINLASCVTHQVFASDNNCSGFLGSYVGYFVVRLIETGDVWIVPPFKISKYDRVMDKLDQLEKNKITMNVIPLLTSRQAGLGIQVRF